MVPRTGFTGAARALIMSGIGFCLFTVLIFSMWTVRAFVGSAGNAMAPGLIGCFFLAIGIGVTLFGVQLGFRTAVLVASSEALAFTQTGPLRKRDSSWPRTTIAAIRRGNSDSEIDNSPLQELQIYLTDGSRARLLAGRGDEELEWIAAVLRSFYGVPCAVV